MESKLSKLKVDELRSIVMKLNVVPGASSELSTLKKSQLVEYADTKYGLIGLTPINFISS